MEYVYVLTISYYVNVLGEQSEIEGAYTTEGLAIQAGEATKILYVGSGYSYCVNKVKVKV